MITENGWAVISESYIYDDDLYDQKGRILADILAYIDRSIVAAKVDMYYLSGSPVFHFALGTNHYTADTDDLIALFRYIAQVAPGSYGQLHVYDDENRFENSVVMDVFVMCRGEVVRRLDPYFTPYLPNVEGPDPDFPPEPLGERMPKYLPIGSVVSVNDSDGKLIIVGRTQKDPSRDQVFDYVGYPYPDGIGANSTIYFNHADLTWIHYLGLTGEDDPMSSSLITRGTSK